MIRYIGTMPRKKSKWEQLDTDLWDEQKQRWTVRPAIGYVYATAPRVDGPTLRLPSPVPQEVSLSSSTRALGASGRSESESHLCATRLAVLCYSLTPMSCVSFAAQWSHLRLQDAGED